MINQCRVSILELLEAEWTDFNALERMLAVKGFQYSGTVIVKIKGTIEKTSCPKTGDLIFKQYC